MTRRIILSLNKNRAFFYVYLFLSLCPSFILSRCWLHSYFFLCFLSPQFATAAESLTFSTKLIFCKTIPESKSFMSHPLCPFLSLFLHFQALRWFALIAFICLLVCLFFLVNLLHSHFWCPFSWGLNYCP